MGGYPTEVAYDDVDAIYVDPSLDRDGEIYQLEPGPLGLRGRLAAFPDVHIYEWAYGQSIMGRELRRDEALRIFVRLDKGPPRHINGRKIPAEIPIARRGPREIEWITPADARILEIDVAPHLVDTMGWAHIGETEDVLRARPEAVSGLVYMAGLVAGFVHANPHLDAERLRAMQDRVLLAVAACVQPDPEPPPSAYRLSRAAQLCSDGLAYLEGRLPDERLAVADMAGALGVSERTLYKAYQDWIGMGPYEFDLIRRMHMFRTDLVRSARKRGRIARSAKVAGFRDQSRLGQMYRRHFGETPSATARRWDDARQAAPDVLPEPRRGTPPR